MEYAVYPLASIAAMVVGAIWYNPKIMGNAWMKASGMTQEMVEGGNMAKIFGLAFIFGCLLAFMLKGIVIHQANLQSFLAFQEGFSDESGESYRMYKEMMDAYGDVHKHFGHGALHGAVAAVFFVWPVVGIISLFERRSWKYIGIHVGYWFFALAVMGGLVCQFAAV